MHPIRKNSKRLTKRILSFVLTLALIIGVVALQSVAPAAATNRVSSITPGQVVMIRNMSTGQFMTALNTSGNTNVVLQGFNSTQNQHWVAFFDDQSSNWVDGFHVRPMSDQSQLLSLQNVAGISSSGSNVYVRGPRSTLPVQQLWHFRYQNNQSFRIETGRTDQDRIIGLEGNRPVLRDNTNGLERQWEVIVPGTVTYNFSRNGGTSASHASLQAFEFAQVNLGVTATRPGWGFAGWNTDPNATTGLTSLQMPNTDVTLYAIFRQTGNVIFRDFNNEINVPWSATSNETGTTVLAPAQTVPAGFAPRGWTTEITPDAVPIVPPSGGSVPVAPVYYGLYERNISISFNAAGGDFTPSSQQGAQRFNTHDFNLPHNPTFTLPPAPERGYHTFAGWTDGTYLYPAEANVNFGQDTELTAVWDEVRVEGVTLSSNNLTLNIADTATLTANIQPANALNRAVTWASSDESIVQVDETGFVQALREGFATITATTLDGGFTDSAQITVMFIEIPVQRVDISQNEAVISYGGNVQLFATAYPALATEQGIVWSSSNPAVAQIDETGLVQAIFPGTAVITATSVEGGHTATANVTVLHPYSQGIRLSSTSAAPHVGQQFDIFAWPEPAHANPAFDFTVSDPSVIAFDGRQVTALAPGVAVITFAQGDVTAQVAVQVQARLVQSILLSRGNISASEIGEKISLNVTRVLPADACNQAYSITVSDPNVISFENGIVTVLGFGTASITFAALDGSGVVATTTVTAREFVSVSEIRLSQEYAMLGVGEQLSIIAQAEAFNATNQQLEITVSNPEIISFEDGIVVALSEGEAYISFEAMDGSGVTAKALVGVVPAGTTVPEPTDNLFSAILDFFFGWIIRWLFPPPLPRYNIWVTNSTGVNVRSEPRTNSTLRTSLRQNDELIATGEIDGWHRLAMGGYVVGTHVSRTRPDGLSSATEALYSAATWRPNVSNYWRPVRARNRPVTNASRFNSGRENNTRFHAGFDFRHTYNMPVFAATGGYVYRYSFFYRDTWALTVRNDDGTVLHYTELRTTLSLPGMVAGQEWRVNNTREPFRIERGQQIGRLIHFYPAHNPPQPPMLHLEHFRGRTAGGTILHPVNDALIQRGNTTYDFVGNRNFGRRRDLLDPTPIFNLPVW